MGGSVHYQSLSWLIYFLVFNIYNHVVNNITGSVVYKNIYVYECIYINA